MSQDLLTVPRQKTPMFQPTVQRSRFRRAIAVIHVCILTGFWLAGTLVPAVGHAQVSKPGGGTGGKSKSGGGFPKSMPGGMGGAGMPGGAGAGLMPGSGGMNPMGGTGAKGKKPAKKTKPKQPAGEIVDPEKIPDGYVVPPEQPDWLTTTEEWTGEEFFSGKDEKEIKKNKNKKLAEYKNILGRGEFLNDDEKKLVASVVRWKLSQMTRKENRESAVTIRGELLRDVQQSPQSKTSKRDTRIFLMQTICEETPKLFEKYHFAARFNGAILLADLAGENEVEAEGRIPAVRCLRVVRPLRDLLENPDASGAKQPMAVRTWGVKGLVRLALYPEVKPQLRGEILELLVKQLAEGRDEHFWLQMRLAEGLGALGIVYDANKKPIVPQVLAEVVADVRRPWLARCESAVALGRLQYGSDVDVSFLSYLVGDLAQQMADAFQKEPRRPEWKLAFLKIYAAYKPLDADAELRGDGLLTQVTSKGSLSSYKKAVQEAYDLVLPIIEKVVKDPKEIELSVTALKTWLKANLPKTDKIAESEKSIKVNSVHPAEGPPAADGARAG